jgi:hypothetical protein
MGLPVQLQIANMRNFAKETFPVRPRKRCRSSISLAPPSGHVRFCPARFQEAAFRNSRERCLVLGSLSAFPIVKREEEQRYEGRFRTRDLILGYMAALAAGAPDANIAG